MIKLTSAAANDNAPPDGLCQLRDTRLERLRARADPVNRRIQVRDPRVQVLQTRREDIHTELIRG